MTHYKEALMRAVGRADTPMVLCSLGFVPRHGKPARRYKDCKLDCRDYEACEGQKRKNEKLE